jgi:O-succinylbenzoate synthase
VAALLPAGRAALAQIAPKAEMGFRVFKWKVGVGDLSDELALLDDVCAQLPTGGKLRLDANGAWDRRQAERWLERCADRPEEFVEQPCFAAAALGVTLQRRTDDMLLGLAADYPTPIGLDESLVGEHDLERWLGAGWPGIFVVKPSLVADVSRALQRLQAVKADVVFSSALETAVGAKTALRAAFAWKQTMDDAATVDELPAKTHGSESGARNTPKPNAARRARALGFGVWPLFADARFDGPGGAPFVRVPEVEAINPESVWNALS